MKWKNLLRSASKSILKNRMRSLLTSLGIIIGVGAVIVMVAVGQGSQVEIEERIGSLGANMIMIFPGVRPGWVSLGAGSLNRLTLDDADLVAQQATLIRAVSPEITVRAQAISGNANWNTEIVGVSVDYPTIRFYEVEAGEFFTERDIRSRSKVVVLGQEVVSNLFPDRDPIGQKIRINNTPFSVIGVLKDKGDTGGGRDQDDVILAPSTTVLYRLKGGRYINRMVASAVSTEAITEAQEEIRALLRQSHKLAETQDDDFRIFNQAEVTETASETSRIMTFLLGAVAGVSLIVGGIGIMNIMLVSVTERTREIGIRLAVGARRSDVLIQFLNEAVVLTLVGGIFGILLASGTSYLLNAAFSIRAVISPWIVLLSFAFAGAVGIFFGYYPAYKASNLNPIDALRYE